MRTEGSIEINRDIQDVFRLTLNHVEQWSGVVVSEEQLTTTPEVLGSTFRSTTESHGSQMVFEGLVTHYDAPYSSAIKLTGEPFDIDVAYRFEDLRGRTRVTQLSIVKGKGMTKLFLSIFGWLMRGSSRTALQEELERLKHFCEQCEHAGQSKPAAEAPQD